MENKKLTIEEIENTLNKNCFLDSNKWCYAIRPNQKGMGFYSGSNLFITSANAFLSYPIAHAIAKAYLRLEVKQAKSKGIKIQGIDQGEKFVVMDFDDNKCLTAKETAESLVSTIKSTSNIIDTTNNESTKQKTDLDFLKESIEIVEVADSVRASIVDAMLDSKEKEIMKEIDIKGSSSKNPVVNFTENLGAFIKEQQEFLDACNKVWQLTLDILDKMKEIECLEKDTIKSIEIFEEKIEEAKKRIEIEENNKESEDQSFTVKEVSEDLAAIINSANCNAGEGVQYYDIIKCTSIQHIVHSGYPLVPETLTCMLDANHKTQHCATDQKGNRINWS